MAKSSKLPFAPTDESPIRDVRGDWVSCREAARIAGCSHMTVLRAAKGGHLRHVVMGSNRRPEYKFERQVAEDFGRARRVSAVMNSRGQRAIELLLELLMSGEADEIPTGFQFLLAPRKRSQV